MGFIRKYLSADGLHEMVRKNLCKEKFPACVGSEYSWQDCLMSGVAIFGLKFPSLLQFEKSKVTDANIRRNLHNLYGVKNAPSDTCLRERLDQISPKQLRRPFKAIFSALQRGKMLENYRYLDGHYIVSIDGTGQYSSKSIHCDNCCEKHHRNGQTTYYHHMLGAVIVHPEHKVVIPIAPEPIIKGDGATKNDCERNASKRLLNDLRREHPHLKLLVVEDGLASNYPHLSLIDSLNMNYIIGVKPGDHKYLFDWIKDLKHKSHIQENPDGIVHEFHYYSNVPLNEEHHQYRVNVLRYTEIKANGKKQEFSWVTRLVLTKENTYEVMRAGRSRWRIENETFNCLKNQGYNFNHNYGHGYKNLCSVMTMLMMLVFLIDQVQQLCCKTYQKARNKVGIFSVLFFEICTLIKYAIWPNFNQLLYFIGEPQNRAPPEGTAWMTC